MQIQNATFWKMQGKDGKGLALMESEAALITLPLPWSTASPERSEKSVSSRKSQGSNLKTGISSLENFF